MAPAMKRILVRSAKANNRTLSAEIEFRLKKTLKDDK